jgi:hypothetical protein
MNNSFLDNTLRDFYNLDRNTQMLYIFSIIILVIVVKIDYHFTNKLLVIMVFIYIIFNYHRSSIKKTLEQYNNFDDLRDYPNVKRNINIATIYFNLIEYKKYDQINYNDSLSSCDKFIELYDKFSKNLYKSQQLDLLEEHKNNCLNYLKSMIYSIPPSAGYSSNHHITLFPVEEKLDIHIMRLKAILDTKFFEANNLARLDYEQNPVHKMSEPIYFEALAPKPYDIKFDNFTFYNGYILQ